MRKTHRSDRRVAMGTLQVRCHTSHGGTHAPVDPRGRVAPGVRLCRPSADLCISGRRHHIDDGIRTLLLRTLEPRSGDVSTGPCPVYGGAGRGLQRGTGCLRTGRRPVRRVGEGHLRRPGLPVRRSHLRLSGAVPRHLVLDPAARVGRDQAALSGVGLARGRCGSDLPAVRRAAGHDRGSKARVDHRQGHGGWVAGPDLDSRLRRVPGRLSVLGLVLRRVSQSGVHPVLRRSVVVVHRSLAGVDRHGYLLLHRLRPVQPGIHDRSPWRRLRPYGPGEGSRPEPDHRQARASRRSCPF